MANYNKSKIKYVIFLIFSIFFIFINNTFASSCEGPECSFNFSIRVIKETVNLTGNIFDHNKNPLIGVLIEILNTNLSQISNGSGFFIQDIEKGLYTIKFTIDGYMPLYLINKLIEKEEFITTQFTLAKYGTINNKVLDFWTQSGIENVKISLYLYDELYNITYSNLLGEYNFNNLPPGNYDLILEKTNFSSLSKSNIEVLCNKTTSFNLFMW